MCDIIKRYEGFRPLAYKCPAGVWTIGYGTTVYPDGTPVKKGDQITEERAEAYLNDYLIKNVRPLFAKIPYTLTQNQEDAICSLVYNVGKGAFLKSKLFKAICEKNYEQIFKNWDWIKAGGVVMKGLVKRRAEELCLFIKDIK